MLFHTQPSSRGEACFHFAMRKQRVSKVEQLAQGHTPSEHRAGIEQSFHLHHPPTPHHFTHSALTYHCSAVFIIHTHPFLCLSKSNPPQNLPKPSPTGCSCGDFLLLGPTGTLLSMTLRAKDTKKALWEVPLGCRSTPVPCVLVKLPQRERYPKRQIPLVFSESPPH